MFTSKSITTFNVVPNGKADDVSLLEGTSS